MIYETNSEQETFLLAKRLGQKAAAGQIYCLTGDLGVGKTVFAQGFARGLGVTDPYITSPTFTIVQSYLGRLPFHHFDVYRIGSEEEMEDTGYEDFFYGDGVCLVEWAELIRPLIPEDACWITIHKDLTRGTEYRKITIKEGT
ncbi:MAG TPA: tRNA (adenosine(37)-N6)-threonylcarbamoyltransferase complex ATPase subunit type 1 TsaE [Firmicutes bacterium]|nr:tRNA (adenosine(37)-N6)-threonylcarbamoyltransferase complex ATPase subunit type 1 TsaE [Bacillota bacterium]